MRDDKSTVLKSAEVAGFKVELSSSEQGSLFRVNVIEDGGYAKTRVFADYSEASALFDSYLQGN